MLRHPLLLPLLALAPFLDALTTSAVTITNANMIYRQGALVTPPSNGWPSADLRA